MGEVVVYYFPFPCRLCGVGFALSSSINQLWGEHLSPGAWLCPGLGLCSSNTELGVNLAVMG